MKAQIDSVYSEYFQKSRSFLYPALEIKRETEYIPTGVYMSIEGLYEPEDCKLICTYKNDDTEKYKLFVEENILQNPLFEKMITVKGYNLYIFDFQQLTSDWFNVLLGKYSKLSVPLKKAIKNYYGENSKQYIKYIQCFLYPEKFFEVYANLLGVEIDILKKVGELCDACDLEKETLKIPIEDLEMLKKTL